MISQETIRPRLCNETDVFPPQRKEVSIISFLEEDVFMIIAAIIDVIEVSIRDRWDVGRHYKFRKLIMNRPDRSLRISARLTIWSACVSRLTESTIRPVRSLTPYNSQLFSRSLSASSSSLVIVTPLPSFS